MAGKQNETYTPDEGTIESTFSESFNYRDLTTPGAIRIEMVRIYKQARAGFVNPQDYSRYVNGLKELCAVIRDTDIEARIKALEAIKK